MSVRASPALSLYLFSSSVFALVSCLCISSSHESQYLSPHHYSRAHSYDPLGSHVKSFVRVSAWFCHLVSFATKYSWFCYLVSLRLSARSPALCECATCVRGGRESEAEQPPPPSSLRQLLRVQDIRSFFFSGRTDNGTTWKLPDRGHRFTRDCTFETRLASFFHGLV